MRDAAGLWSLTKLALAIERDRQALARALNDLPPDESRKSGRGTDRFWRLARVLRHPPVLQLLANGIVDLEEGELDLDTERARLAKWQADSKHQDVELRAGKLLLDDDVRHWVVGMISTAKQRLVQIPETVRQIVHPDHAELVATEVRRIVYEALAELAAHREDGPRSDVDALGAAAHVNGKPVGGSVPKAVERKQRRARAMAN